MSHPIKKFSSGKVNCAVWAQEYNGQLSYKYSFQKSYKNPKTGEWENTNSFTITDLHDLVTVCNKLLNENIKEHAPQQQFQQNNNYHEEVQPKPQTELFNDGIPF